LKTSPYTELCRMQESIFRAEVTAKRAATTKSKTYRQLKKNAVEAQGDPFAGEGRSRATEQNADRVVDDFIREMGG
jgi:U3 small nucleolar RNA-associated protein 14